MIKFYVLDSRSFNFKQRTLPHIHSYNCTQDTKDARVKIVVSYLVVTARRSAHGA